MPFLLILSMSVSAGAQSLPTVDAVAWDATCEGVPSGAERFLGEGTPSNALSMVTINVDGTYGEPTDAVFPDALCNDYTAAIYYVRPGEGADADRWLITPQGTGGCGNWSQCTDRWCGNGKNYSAEWMSSSEATPTIAGGGILFPDPDVNQFARWNHVFIKYCSSDQWVGRQIEVELHNEADPSTSYKVAFAGRFILDAVMTELRDHPKKLQDLGMPDLDDASVVLFGGSTAGGNGLIYNIDRLAEELRSANPTVDVRMVLDSNFYPAADTVNGAPYTHDYNPDDEGQYRMFSDLLEVYDPESDASCMEVRSATGDDWWCGERMHVLTHHVTTPFFVHIDLADHENPICGVSHNDGYDPPPNCEELVLEQLLVLEDIADPSIPRETPPVYEPTAPLPGFHAPRCDSQSHAKLETDEDNHGVFEVQVPVGDVATATEWVSLHEALWNWMDGNGGVTNVYRELDGGSLCPTPPPIVPLGFQLTYDEPADEILLRWGKPTYADEYTVFWSTTSTEVTDQDEVLVTLTTTEHLVAGPFGELQCYAVRAKNAVGLSPISHTECLDLRPPQDTGVTDTGASPPVDTGSDAEPCKGRACEPKKGGSKGCGCRHGGLAGSGWLAAILLAWRRRRR